MTSNATACPFCNGLLPTLPAPPTDAKLPCPRCGEPVPVSRWQVDTAIASGEPKIKIRVEERKPGVPGTRTTAVIMVSIMLTMAIIGLSYALWTTKLRRSRDPKLLLDPVAIQRPLELKGLSYLPKDSHVIVGLHIAEWLADKKVGKPLLDEPRPAYLDTIVKQLPRVTGMALEELDHVVLAASFDNPQLVAIVKTRKPYALDKIVESVRPSASTLYQERALYEFSLKPMGEAMLWCVEEKTLIYVIRLDAPKRGHLQGLSATPRKLEEVLSAPIHEAMKERLPRQPFLWCVGRFDQLGLLKDVLPLLLAGKADLGAFKDLKTAALGLEPIEGLTLTGHFQMSDAKSALKFKTFLDNVKVPGAASQKVEAPPADKEPWLTWQVRGDVAVMRDLLNSGKK